MTTPRVHGLNGFGLDVPDLAKALHFYGSFGLEIQQAGDAMLLRSPGRKNDEIVISRGATKRLNHLSFYFDPADREAFRATLSAAGLAVTDVAPAGGYRGGLWFRDPWGTWINLSPSIPTAMRAETNLPNNDPNRRERVDIAAWCELARERGPLRLGHLLIFTPEMQKTERFLCDMLGMRVSDRSVGKVSFLAAGNGIIDHHCFGLVNSTHRGLQHASFQVCGIDDIGFGTWRMREAGYADGFGPGRHALASNLFHYFRDPWGSWVEYYADMDKISDDWKSKDWSALPYIWGPEWSPEFWGGQMNANLEPR
jgi:catechol 2,3-dioxygenase-like lactoylglutathione lyase family enzyme